MIRVQKHSDSELHIIVTEESRADFIELINRALNCWDAAPKDLKDLGDMITHGRVTQDHTYKRVGSAYTAANSYSDAEKTAMAEILKEVGLLKYQQLLLGDRVEFTALIKAKLK
jgi:hypothetical protein